MAGPKLSKLELQIMGTLWTKGECSIRDVLEAFPGKKRPGYGTVQTTMYRMEVKKIVRRVKKVANFHIFAPMVSRDEVHSRLIDELLALFGGRSQLVMMHLVKSGNLRLEDVREVERELQRLADKEES